MDQPCQQCLLDSHTPAAVIDIFNSLADATNDLIELIKATPHQHLKKLRTVFLSIDNYDIEAVVLLTQSSNRLYRYSSTYLALSRIKIECKKKVNFDKIEYLYDNVFTVRFRDVDPMIRGMAVQFVSEFIYDNPTLRKVTYLKYVGWALNDRNDSVRRRALKGIAKLAVAYGRVVKQENKENLGYKRRKIDENDEFKMFFDKHKARLVEMACYDTNMNLQREAGTVIFILHRTTMLFGDEELAKVLNKDGTVTPEKQNVMGVLLPDGVWDMERIHDLYKLLNAEVFANWKLGPSDLESFVLNISNFIKERSLCCDSSSLCYLSILKAMELSIDPIIFLPLVETARDNNNNIALIVQCISKVVSPKEFAGSVVELLKILLGIALEDLTVFGSFMELLRGLENDFDVLVAEILKHIKEVFKEEYFIHMIKHFDVTELLCDSSSSVEKCYAALWLVTRSEYFKLELLSFGDAKNLNVLVDFLVMFHEQAGVRQDDTIEELEEKAKIIVDGRTAFIRLYCGLYRVVSSNLRFEDEESCLYLFKLINLNLFGDSADLLFKYCCNETLTQLISIAKYTQPIVTGYLRAVAGEKRLYGLARQVASKISQNGNDRFVFRLLRQLVDQKHLLDSVLIYFVSALNASEAIVLEAMASRSKFKTACARLCRVKAPAKIEEVETII